MAKLITLTEQMQPGTLPPNILRGVYKGMVLAGFFLSILCWAAIYTLFFSRSLLSRPSGEQHLLRQNTQSLKSKVQDHSRPRKLCQGMS